MTRSPKRSALPRRSLLRGTIGGLSVACGLPLLEAMLDDHGEALAAGTPLPRRFGIWYWGNGMKVSRWVPAATGAGWKPSELLAPLAASQAYVNVVTGMKLQTGDPRAHHSGQVGILSSAPLIPKPPTGGAPFASTFRLPSLDQVAARLVGGDTRFPSLEIGITRRNNRGEGSGLGYLSHNGPDNFNPPETDAAKLFSRLFSGGVTPNAPSVSRVTQTLRASVLDAVLGDLASLRNGVGASDRARLDQHTESVRALEKQLETAPPPVTSSCKVPAAAQAVADGAREPVEEQNRVMSDLLTVALACDLTRAFSVMYSGGVSTTVYWQLGLGDEHHGLTHNEPGDQPKVASITTFIMKQLAYLVDRFRQTPDGAGTLLDSLSMLVTSDCSEGREHALTEYPLLVVGKGNGALKHPGVHHRAPDDNASKVLFTALRAGGVPVTEIGLSGGKVSSGCSEIEA